MFSELTKFCKKINFSKPEFVEIIIFDETNSNVIRGVIPENFTVSLFKMHPMEIYITPRILFNFIRNLKYFKFRKGVASNRGLFYKIFWQLFCIYIKADLISRNPLAIITSIDNSGIFGWLSENYHQAPCIAIQNGFRLTYSSNSQTKYYCQHLFCFGGREAINYPKMGYKVDHFYPVGSLHLSNNFNNKLVNVTPIYDFLVVSCWRGNIGFAKDVEDSMKAMRVMDELLSQYLSQRNLRAAVILRSERDSDQWVMPEIGMSEEEYYRSIYGDLIEIIDVNFSERNVYPVMQSADTIIAAFPTTCLIEAYAIGKKVLYTNFCGTNKYHVDIMPEILFQGSVDNYVEFKSRLDSLLASSSDTYIMEHKDLMNYYMKMPNPGSTRGAIKAKINDIVTLSLT